MPLNCRTDLASEARGLLSDDIGEKHGILARDERIRSHRVTAVDILSAARSSSPMPYTLPPSLSAAALKRRTRRPVLLPRSVIRTSRRTRSGRLPQGAYS